MEFRRDASMLNVSGWGRAGRWGDRLRTGSHLGPSRGPVPAQDSVSVLGRVAPLHLPVPCRAQAWGPGRVVGPRPPLLCSALGLAGRAVPHQRAAEHGHPRM